MSAVASAAARNRQTAGGLIKQGVTKPFDELGKNGFLRVSRMVPDKHLQLGKAMVQMCCAGDNWVPRCMILTNRGLYLTDEAQHRTILDIPLIDIKDIVRVDEKMATYENRQKMQSSFIKKLARRGSEQLRKFSGSSTLLAQEGERRDSKGSRRDSENAGKKDYVFQIRTHVPSVPDESVVVYPTATSGPASPMPKGTPKEEKSEDKANSGGPSNMYSKRRSTRSSSTIAEEGRIFFFKWLHGMSDEKEAVTDFLDNVKKHVHDRKQKEASAEHIWAFRLHVANVYFSWQMQGIVAVFIFANFVVNAVQAQMTPEEGTPEEAMFNTLDTAFTILFTIELVVNLFVNWLTPFLMDSWNIFDTIVVVTSLIALGLQGLPGVSILRIVRAFRVLRLFGRLGSLRRIINALTSSWLPVLNAFAVVMFITAIYAILGVTFFAKRSPLHFGSFSKSFYTMFTVTTMEGWVDLVATDLFDDPDVIDSGAVIFMVSFIVIVVWTMLPVVVAILLDNFTMAASREESKEEERMRLQQTVEIHHSLDPIMSKLMMHASPEDLKYRIQTFFQALNVDEAETISYEAMHDGLLRINDDLSAPIHLSREEFDKLTKEGRWCDENGNLTEKQFEKVILWELMDYSDRVATNSFALELDGGSAGIAAILSSLKMQNLASAHLRWGEEGFNLVESLNPPKKEIHRDPLTTPKALNLPPIAQITHPPKVEGASAPKLEAESALLKRDLNPKPAPSPLQGNGHKNPDNLGNKQLENGQNGLQDHFENLSKAQEEMQMTVKKLQAQLHKVQQKQDQQLPGIGDQRNEESSSGDIAQFSRMAMHPSCGFCVKGMGNEHCWTCGIVMCWECRVEHKQVFETQHHVVRSLKEQINLQLSEPLGTGLERGPALFGPKLALRPLRNLAHKAKS